jgi:hypothetical protein
MQKLLYTIVIAALASVLALPRHSPAQSANLSVAASAPVASVPSNAELVWLKDSIVSDVVAKSAPKPEKGWSEPTVLVSAGAVLLAIASLTFSFYQFRRNRVDSIKWKKRDSRANRQAKLLDSLKWFEGGIQNRAVGIAVIEGHWVDQPELRSTWASVLVSQAVYIISKPEAKLPQHEARNLERILALLRRSVADIPAHRFGEGLLNPVNSALSDLQVKNTEVKDGKVLTPRERKQFIGQVLSAASTYRDILTVPEHRQDET